MIRQTPRSIGQIDFERRWLTAKVAHGGLGDSEQNDLVRRIEDLELAIAATPVNDIDDLAIKVERLAAAFHPSLDPIPEDSIEAVLLKAVMTGCRRLSDHGQEARSGA